jgi:hypothetical protein
VIRVRGQDMPGRSAARGVGAATPCTWLGGLPFADALPRVWELAPGASGQAPEGPGEGGAMDPAQCTSRDSGGGSQRGFGAAYVPGSLSLLAALPTPSRRKTYLPSALSLSRLETQAIRRCPLKSKVTSSVPTPTLHPYIHLRPPSLTSPETPPPPPPPPPRPGVGGGGPGGGGGGGGLKRHLTPILEH